MKQTIQTNRINKMNLDFEPVVAHSSLSLF